MVDQIEVLKQKYTDKYVVVDKDRPELARFRDTYGTVKTVNMSGRALVEFADYHLNIGWYDIDPSFLKLIDAPLPPKPKEAAPAKTPAAKKSPGEAASAAGSAPAKSKPKPAGATATAGKPSTADILAKLRGGGGAPAKPAGAAPAEKAASPPAKPATPKPAAAPAGKVDRSKMSVADMLAAARAGKAGGSAPAAAAPAPTEPEPVEDAAEASVGEPALAGGQTSAESIKRPNSGGPIDKKTMSIDQMCAWCREHDAK
jgi:hypothetical protein